MVGTGYVGLVTELVSPSSACTSPAWIRMKSGSRSSPEGRPHVATDGVNGASSPGAQPGKEALHRGRGSVPAHPHHAATVEIIDDRQVLLPLAAADLIEADDLQREPAAMGKAPEDGAIHDRLDRFPIEPEVRRHRRPVQLPGQLGHGPGQGVGHPLPLLGAGKPVVTRDVGACREIVCHGVNGYLVPGRDPEQFARYTLDLFADPARAREMGQAGQRLAADKFSLPAMIRATEGLYGALLASLAGATG